MSPVGDPGDPLEGGEPTAGSPGRPSGRALGAVLLGVLVLPGPGTAQTGNGADAADTLRGPPPAVDVGSVRLGRDTVVAAPGEVYPAGSVHRFLLGDLNRDLWHLEFPVPVLDLDSVGGGLSVDELSGGKQTLGLRFVGRDGLVYQFRSIVKTAARALPSPLRSTAVTDVFQDQMAAQFPLSAMVVAELLDAAGVMVARPRPVVMPDDPRLGEFRELFAGRMGWIEIRPDERETEDGREVAGFGGSSKITGSEELYEELNDDPESYVDDDKLVRARLVDMMVGDWDRHSDQWRWASYPDGERTRWEPIPRDRDWAFARIDGVLPRLTGVYNPGYVGFGAERPDPDHLHWSAQRVDRTLLSGLERADFLQAARDLQQAFDDATLERAVGVLPESYRNATGEELLEALRLRRDALEDVAEEYYELLAGWVDVHGTEELDSVAVTPEGSGLRVRVWAPREGDFVRYDRLFHASETEDVRIYLGDGDDRVVVHGSLPIPIRIVTGGGDDVVIDRGDGRNVRVYDDTGRNRLDLGPDAFATESDLLAQDSLREADRWIWETRDWGSAWVPRPELWFDSDIGLYAGLGVARYGFGFGQEPYHSKLSVSVLNGMSADQWVGSLELDRALGDRGWRTVAGIDGRTHEPVWLFGIGNGTPAPDDEDDYRSFRTSVRVRAGLRYRAWSDWTATVGPELFVAGAVEPGGEVFDRVEAYGAGEFAQVGIGGALEVDTRDSEQYPRMGRRWSLGARIVPSLLDVEDAFGGLTVDLREYLSGDLPGQPALHLRLRGQKTWGRTPFFELPWVGGAGSLPGYVSRRFVGDASASATGLLRLELLDSRLVTDVQLGVHGLGSVGRVWNDGDAADGWHVGRGGGLWLRLPSIDRTLSVTLVHGDTGVRTYLDFGFIF